MGDVGVNGSVGDDVRALTSTSPKSPSSRSFLPKSVANVCNKANIAFWVLASLS